MVTIRRHVRNSHVNSGIHAHIGNNSNGTDFSKWLSTLASGTPPPADQEIKEGKGGGGTDPADPNDSTDNQDETIDNNPDDSADTTPKKTPQDKAKRAQEKFVLDIFAALDSMAKEDIYITEIQDITVDESNKPTFLCKRAILSTDFNVNQEETLGDVERICVRNAASAISEKYSESGTQPPKTIKDFLGFCEKTPQKLSKISEKFGTPVLAVEYPSYDKLTKGRNISPKTNEAIYTTAYECRKLTSEVCARAFPDSDIELWFAAMDMAMRLSAVYIPKLVSLNKRITLKEKKNSSNRLERYCLMCPLVAWYYLYDAPVDEAEYMDIVTEYQADMKLDINGALEEIGSVVYDPYWYQRAGENIEDAVSKIALNRGDIKEYFDRDGSDKNIPDKTLISQIISM